MSITRRIRKSLGNRVLSVTLLCVITRLRNASAELDWSVTLTYHIGDFDQNRAGMEILIIYDVTNNSPEGDANALTRFSAQGGSNQGVYLAFDQTGTFNYDVFGDNIVWNGGAVGADGGNNRFYLYASYLGDPVQGTVSATSRGIETPEHFGNLSAWTVIGNPPSPSVLSLQSIVQPSSLVSRLGVHTSNFFAPAAPSFRIASTTNLTTGVWTTNSTLHSVTGAVTTVTVTNTSDRAFFKIVEE